MMSVTSRFKEVFSILLRYVSPSVLRLSKGSLLLSHDLRTTL